MRGATLSRIATATVIACASLGMGTVAHAADLTGDPAAGEEIWQECSGCHEVGPDAVDAVGPHLNGLFGRRAGSHADYPYSDGLVRMGSDGLFWDFETLDAYIENPLTLVSGTRMGYPGLAAPQDRTDLLAFLRLYSDNPADIPEAPRTANPTDHGIDPAILALEGDPEYGEYLSSECTTCHQADGSAQGIPSITQWPEDAFVVAMHAYKRKLRPHQVMQMIAGRLNDEEIASLAAYFSSLEPR